MLVSYEWLSEYVDLNGISPKDLAEKITRSGIEVEMVQILDKEIQNVVVGHVLSKEKHPEADKLNICMVDVGEENPLQIVCGAANVAAGQKVAVAKVGAVLPGNFKIKKAKLRGVVSNGMICSLAELGMETKVVAKEYSAGIFNFPSDTKIGQNAMEALGFQDAVLELGLTPNRSDCLSMIGVAYEVAALLNEKVHLNVPQYQAGPKSTTELIQAKVEVGSPLYVLKAITNVKIGRSPMWLESRLMKAGVRPINNVVDITNYILLEYGQPLHAFDYNKLNTKEIIVRQARDQEQLETLDGIIRTLTSDDLVITDGTKPVALAGVMGGSNSEVDAQTTTVILESAVFDRQAVRNTSKLLGLRSEASARFEKGIDMNRVIPAVEMAAAMLEKYAGATVCEGISMVQTKDSKAITVQTTLNKINGLLGTEISTKEVLEIFNRLGFSTVETDGMFTVEVPTRRWDILIEEDLIEEVGRLYGYDRIPCTLPKEETTIGQLNRVQKLRRLAKRMMETSGLQEAISYGLTSEEKSKMFSLYSESVQPIELMLPMSEERNTLRLSLIPHLLDALGYNLARKNEDVALYEMGNIYLPSANPEELPTESNHLAAAMTGNILNHPWQGETKKVDFFYVKGVIEALCEALGISEHLNFVRAENEGFHPGRCADIVLESKNKIGVIGQIHPELEKTWGIKETYAFELNFTQLTALSAAKIRYKEMPRFPGMTRDIALVVDKQTTHAELQETIVKAGGKLLKSVALFDVYMGDRVGAGKKSMAYSLLYLDPERTLTEEEVIKVHDMVLQALAEKNGAVLR